MSFKTALATFCLIMVFVLTGWIMNWPPLNVMLTNAGYFAEDCISDPCNEQQVSISTLWSFVMLSEFTVLPNGIIMDYIGPALFSLFLGVIHVISMLSIYYMSKNSSLLVIPFFCIGLVTQGCYLLASRTVFIFDSREGRKRWVVAVCALYDTSAISTMFFFEFWELDIIRAEDVFLILAVIGGALLFAQFVCWIGLRRADPVRDVYLTPDEGSSADGPTLSDIFCGCKYYFFLVFCAINVYRIQYFLGVVVYTLHDLNDNGTYLHILGYSFALSVVVSPLANKVLGCIDSWAVQFHLVNGLVTSFFVTWLIPNLPVQLVTFTLFVIARLYCFTVLTEYCTAKFSENRVGLVLGSGLTAASLPGAFTYKIVDVVLEMYHGNFWVFHVMCIGLGSFLSLLICGMGVKTEKRIEV